MDEKLFESAKKLALNFENLSQMRKIPLYNEALAVIKRLKNPENRSVSDLLGAVLKSVPEPMAGS